MNTNLLIIIGYIIFYYISWMIKKHKIKKENFNNKENLFTVEVKKQPPSEFQLYNQLMKKKKNKKKGIVLYNVGPIMAFIVCVAAVFQFVRACTAWTD